MSYHAGSAPTAASQATTASDGTTIAAAKIPTGAATVRAAGRRAAGVAPSEARSLSSSPRRRATTATSTSSAAASNPAWGFTVIPTPSASPPHARLAPLSRTLGPARDGERGQQQERTQEKVALSRLPGAGGQMVGRHEQAGAGGREPSPRRGQRRGRDATSPPATRDRTRATRRRRRRTA